MHIWIGAEFNQEVLNFELRFMLQLKFNLILFKPKMYTLLFLVVAIGWHTMYQRRLLSYITSTLNSENRQHIPHTINVTSKHLYLTFIVIALL